MSENVAAGSGVSLAGRAALWTLAGAGLIAALILIWLAVMLSGNFGNFRPRPAPEVSAAKSEDVYEIGSIVPIAGTPLFAIDINRDAQRSRGPAFSSGGKYGATDRRNILLLDGTTGESAPILQGYRQRIVDAVFLPRRATQPGRGDALAAMDTPEDKVSAAAAYYVVQIAPLEDDKGVSILVGNLSTRKQAIVQANLNGVDALWMLDDHRLGLLVRENKRLFYRVVDIPGLKVEQSKPIPI